jgi:glycosyltransferase involved in cell wall biosynthesis
MPATLSVVIITLNEEANIGRTLASVRDLIDKTRGEIIIVDSGSTDHTIEIAKSFGAKVFVEPWKGYAAQKNSAIAKASRDWILSLDADEEVSAELAKNIFSELDQDRHKAYWLRRRNYFLGRWIRRGGFYPDKKLRLFARGLALFPEQRLVHEDVHLTKGSQPGILDGDIIHHAYPTLQNYIGHMNKYSSLGAEMTVAQKPRGFSMRNIVVRPWVTFVYNYFLRLGFLDGKEGFLLHLYHSVYVSWKYAKAWELSRAQKKEIGQSAKSH